jgi:hypothetical protein
MNGSVKDATLVSWNHVLNVDKGVLSSSLLQQLKGLSYEVTKVQSLSLAVLDLVANTCVVISKDVEDGKYLSVVGDKGLANHLSR